MPWRYEKTPFTRGLRSHDATTLITHGASGHEQKMPRADWLRGIGKSASKDMEGGSLSWQ
jgi:hypothetical protein